MTASLFDPITIGDLSLPNRVIMAPLTRMRSKQPGNIPWALNATYYAQRAGAGLIISEASQISQQGQGYPGTPGIHSPEQVSGWKDVTKAVHEAGGRIFMQLWHVGRVSHTSFHSGQPPVAPSAIALTEQVMTAEWKMAAAETPRALETAEIAGIVADYVAAAKNALEAGFDGVEIHAANGYLLDQFLQDGTNKRDDVYGGSIENRARFLLEVVDAVTAVVPSGRVGVRLSPYGTFNSMSDSDPVALFSHVLRELSKRKLGYAHLVEPRWSAEAGADTSKLPQTAKIFREAYAGVLITAGGYDRESALAALANGSADAVAFGRYYISNPDLAQRLAADLPLTPYNRATFYGGTEKGYTDYAVADKAVAA